jgi:hypothetical protein
VRNLGRRVLPHVRARERSLDAGRRYMGWALAMGLPVIGA